MALTVKAVKFTVAAKLQLQDTIEYIMDEFGFLTAEKFMAAFSNKIADIAAGKITHRYFLKSKQIHYFIFNNKNYILYTDTPLAILIVGVYGAKQDIRKIRNRFNK